MKNRSLLLFVLLIAVSVFVGCGRPRVIPDQKLTQIFKESFLANAIFTPGTTDSLDLYGPILKKYGYRIKDLEYTIADFSKQKSAKLSDVVEAAIKELQQEADYYSGRVAVLDTVNARSRRALSREVYSAERIEARQIADTAKLRISIPAEEGSYIITYISFLDSLDRNQGIRTGFYIIDRSGRKRPSSSNYYSSNRTQRFRAEVGATREDSIVEIIFGSYRQNLSRPYLTIDSLRIDYLLPAEIARDSVLKHYLKINTNFHDNSTNPPDSGALRLYPFGDATMAGDND